MRLTWILTIAMLPVSLSAQRKADPDYWKPCQEFSDKYKVEVENFNAEHKEGPQVYWMCTTKTNSEPPKKPSTHVALTPSETIHLHELRRMEDNGYKAIEEYEDYLYKAHRVHKPEIGDRCWYYVGFVLDQDFITIDPNVAFDDPTKPDCTSESAAPRKDKP